MTRIYTDEVEPFRAHNVSHDIEGASKRKLDQYESKEVQLSLDFRDSGGGAGKSFKGAWGSSIQQDNHNSEGNRETVADAFKEEPDTFPSPGIYILSPRPCLC